MSPPISSFDRSPENVEIDRKAREYALRFYRPKDGGATYRDHFFSYGTAYRECQKEFKAERDELRQALFEAYIQGVGGLGADGKYDHMCLSTWEHLQDDLIEWGLLKPEECSRK